MVGNRIQRQGPSTVGFHFDKADSTGRTRADKRNDGGSHLSVLNGHRGRFQYIVLGRECCLDLPQFNAETAAFYLPVEPSQKKIVAIGRMGHTIPGAVIACSF